MDIVHGAGPMAAGYTCGTVVCSTGIFVCPNPIFSTVREEKIAVGQPQRMPNLCDQREQVNMCNETGYALTRFSDVSEKVNI